LPDFDGDHLGRHLLVQGFDDAAKLAWYLVRDEDQPNPPRLQIGARLFPVRVNVCVGPQNRCDLGVCVAAFALEPRREPLAQLPHRPVDDRVRRVVDQLPDNLAPESRVRASLHLDERWHTVLIEEDVVDRPPSCSLLRVGHARFALDQDPTPCVAAGELIAGEQIGELGEKLLQNVLPVVGSLRHRHEVVSATQEEDVAAHSATLRPASDSVGLPSPR
jgi:hypothetical protein